MWRSAEAGPLEAGTEQWGLGRGLGGGGGPEASSVGPVDGTPGGRGSWQLCTAGSVKAHHRCWGESAGLVWICRVGGTGRP